MTYISRFSFGSCGASDDADNQRIAVLFGFAEVGDISNTTTVGNGYDNGNILTLVAWNATMRTSSQLLCKPMYNISWMDVVRDGLETRSIALSDDASPRSPDTSIHGILHEPTSSRIQLRISYGPCRMGDNRKNFLGGASRCRPSHADCLWRHRQAASRGGISARG